MTHIHLELIQAIRTQYPLPWREAHGITRWARVRAAGLRLAARTEPNSAVVKLFAALHDARRRNEGFDPGRGEWGTDFAAILRGTLIHPCDADFTLLPTACADHGMARRRHHDPDLLGRGPTGLGSGWHHTGSGAFVHRCGSRR
jgi:hypothetical protein